MAPLSVVIPSRNITNLRECVLAIRRNEANIRVIVVDDGLDLGGFEPDLEECWIVPGRKPFVFARNCNVGISFTGESDVILLNDDAVLETPGGFGAMQAAAGDYGLVAPAVKGPSNSREHAPRGSGMRPMRGLTIPFVAVLIPCETIDTVGLLDERFDCYGGDDDDYCYRVRAAGLKIGIFDGCVVNHGSLHSTFRPHGGGLPIHDAQRIFKEIHGFDMATR